MITDNTIICTLAGDQDLRAPADRLGTYIAVLAAAPSKQDFNLLLDSCSTPETLLAAATSFSEKCSNFITLKVGEVKPGNLFLKRCKGLASAANVGRRDQALCVKLHSFITRSREDGDCFGLVLMLPVAGFATEQELGHHWVDRYGCEFGNYGRSKAGNGRTKIDHQPLPMWCGFESFGA